METTTNRLRALRNEHGVAMRALAVRAGTQPAMLSDIELYGRVPGPPLRQRIADALGVTVADIWPDVEANQPAGRGVRS